MPECSSNKTKHDLVAHYVSVLLLFKTGSNLEQSSMGPTAIDAISNHVEAK